MSGERVSLAAAVIRNAQTFAVAMDEASARMQEYQDVKGDSGVYTDEELVGLGITAQQLTKSVAFLEAFATLVANGVPNTGQYRKTLNSVRRVPAQV